MSTSTVNTPGSGRARFSSLRSLLATRPVGAFASTLIAGLFGWLLWFPMRDASPYLDDYVFIALGQHIRNPFALLFGDAMGTFFFRPVAMFLWAISVELLGNGARAQLALNIALHCGNALLTHQLLRRSGISASASAIPALLFLVHPTAFSAAAWLADRFDLLSLFFGLTGLIALRGYLARPGVARFIATCAGMLCSMLSKEIGFALVAPALAMALWPGAGKAASPRQRATVGVVVVLCALGAVAARVLTVRSVTETMFLSQGILPALASGTLKWWEYLPAFVGARHASPAALAAQAPLAVALVALFALPAARKGLAGRPVLEVIVLGLLTMGACSVVQSPVVSAFAITPYNAGGFVSNALAGCRFYYVALAGLALVIGGFAESLARSIAPARALRAVAGVAVAMAIVGLLVASRGIAREWTAFIQQRDAPVLRAAVAVVERQRFAPPGCKIYLLDLPKDAISVASLLDTAVKQALPRGDPHVACFIQSEHAPWYHLLEARNLPSDAYKPLEIIAFNGKPYPPLPVSNLAYFYLKSVDGRAIAEDPKARFYAYDGHTFNDVTADVRSGRRVIHFYDSRPLF
ncbi:MAG TPA: hypothetical protein VFE23_16830 [Usitatibacter sp.]|jgi:hypothetical protein|nr:hypothetical protein [Usitatibacter sp.]